MHPCQRVGFKVHLLSRTSKRLDLVNVAQPQKRVRERELEGSRKKNPASQDDLKGELQVFYGAMLQFSLLGFE